ncbi:P-loop containing nucleoside triphosphate hydrolase protein [Zopfochytrium polystomum]|nr:P-loop containing nucleoside triphosphate hydrolase protein [Zopfochytrium polystomum]
MRVTRPCSLLQRLPSIRHWRRRLDPTWATTTPVRCHQLPLLPVLAPSPAPTLGEWSIAPNMNTAGLVEAFEKACGGVRAGKEVSMNFQFSGLSLRLPTTGKWILRGVTGEIRSGSMTAVMGPSGAGKTTFMNVLMGKVKRTGGELKINGTVAEMEQFKKLIGYVPQEDIMLRELTAREVITYAARIRLPDSWAKQEIDAHVDNVLKALNLEEVAHTPIGNELTRGISGGQRKRVNIGMELAAAPLALFLDEPTSGLDATAALDVARILQTVSRIGLTVVSVIHQPRVEIFKSFDNVLMIVPGGRTAYLGPVALSQPYFEALGFVFEPNANPADVLMDILAGRGIFTRGGSSTPSKGDLVKIWAAWGRTLFADPSATALVRGAIPPSSLWPWSTSLGGQTSSPTTAAPPKTSSNDSTGPTASSSSSTPPPADALAAMRSLAHVRGATLLTQTLESHNRAVVQQFRFLSAFWMELFVGMFAGAVMGIAANVTEAFRGVLRAPFQGLSSAPQDWFVALYGMLIGVAVSLAASPPAVKVFGEEKSVYYREAASGHSKIAYYIGKTLASFYRIALASAHFTAVYYLLAKPALPVALQFALLFLNFYAI